MPERVAGEVMRRASGVALVLLMAASAAFAYPTLTGASGLAVTPTTKVLPAGALIIGVDGRGTEAGRATPVRVQWGAMRLVEVAGGYVPSAGQQGWTVGIKYRLPEPLNLGSVDLPGIPSGLPTLPGMSRPKAPKQATVSGMLAAVGATVSQAGGTGVQTTQAYAVLGRPYLTEAAEIPVAYLTLGATATRIGGGEGVVRGMASVAFTTPRGMVLSGEWQENAPGLAGDVRPMAAYTLRYPVSSKVAMQVGVTNADGVLGSARERMFVGASMVISPGKSAANASTVKIPLTRTRSIVMDQNGNVSVIPYESRSMGTVTVPKWW